MPTTTNFSPCLTAVVAPSSRDAVSINLNKPRGVIYKLSVNPTPRNAQDVDEWWRKIVRLFKKGLLEEWTLTDEEAVRDLVCPEDLKDVLRSQFKHENLFNAALFEALRTGLMAHDVPLLLSFKDERGASGESSTSTREPSEDGLSWSYQPSKRVKSDELVKPENPKVSVDQDRLVLDPFEGVKSFETLVVDESKPEESVKNLGPIIFANGMHSNFAIGIAREVNGEQKDSTVGRRNGQASQTISGLAPKTKVDQCACVLAMNTNGTWEAVDCLSAVELKMTNCKSFETGANGKTIAQSLNVDFSGRSAIAQVLLYTMDWVLPSLAKLGQLTRCIPWAVIVGNKDPIPDSDPGQNRWVCGQINPPAECGGQFYYAVTGYERLNHTETADAVDKALSVYLETFYFGLAAAKKWLFSLANGIPCDRHPTSGISLMIGKTALPNLKLYATPSFRQAVASSSSSWRVTQGEIFTGQLNLADLPAQNILAFCALKDRVVDVAVKVSSLAVHRFFTNPERSHAAIKEIWLALQRRENVKQTERFAEAAKEAERRAAEATKEAERFAEAAKEAERRVAEATKEAERRIAEATKEAERRAAEATKEAERRFAEQHNEVVKQLLNLTQNMEGNSTGGPTAAQSAAIALLKRSIVPLSSRSPAENSELELQKPPKLLLLPDGCSPEDAEAELPKQPQSLLLPSGSTEAELPKPHDLLMPHTPPDNQTAPPSADSEAESPAPPVLLPDLSDVLLAVYKPKLGLITIMANLSLKGFHLLEPEKCKSSLYPVWLNASLAALWDAFIDLLRAVLIPMANLNVIHPDIRPGYDETSNILVKFEFSGKATRPVVMKIIDFESLRICDGLQNTVEALDSRYVHETSDEEWTAPKYLWWQCVLIAYAWKNKKIQDDMTRLAVQTELKSVLESEKAEAINGIILKEPKNNDLDWFERFGTDEFMTDSLALKLRGLF